MLYILAKHDLMKVKVKEHPCTKHIQSIDLP